MHEDHPWFWRGTCCSNVGFGEVRVVQSLVFVRYVLLNLWSLWGTCCSIFGFGEVRVAQSLALVRYVLLTLWFWWGTCCSIVGFLCSMLLTIVILCHCIVCPFLVYGFWLPLWYLETCLTGSGYHYNMTSDLMSYAGLGLGFMVFYATFNNISVISWRSVLLMEETGENHRPVTS